MKRASRGCLLVLLGLAAMPVQGALLEVPEMVARLRRADESTSLVLRLLLSVESGDGRVVATQISLKRRRDPGTIRLLYQLLWPATVKGVALYVEQTGTAESAGFLFKPGTGPEPLTTEILRRPFLDSDLLVEDLVTDYWQWPDHEVEGEATVKGETCAIIRSRPPEGAGAYTLICTWVSKQRMLPLRIEKIMRDGGVTKTFTMVKATRHDGLWVPQVTVVQAAGNARQTRIEIVRATRGVEIPLQDFARATIMQSSPSESPAREN